MLHCETIQECKKKIHCRYRQKSKTTHSRNQYRKEKETKVEEDPNAILAIEKLQQRRHRSRSESSDSSLESADQNLLELEVR